MDIEIQKMSVAVEHMKVSTSMQERLLEKVSLSQDRQQAQIEQVDKDKMSFT